MEIIRFYDHTTGFDELYEGYIKSQIEKIMEIADTKKNTHDEEVDE